MTDKEFVRSWRGHVALVAWERWCGRPLVVRGDCPRCGNYVSREEHLRMEAITAVKEFTASHGETGETT